VSFKAQVIDVVRGIHPHVMLIGCMSDIYEMHFNASSEFRPWYLTSGPVYGFLGVKMSDGKFLMTDETGILEDDREVRSIPIRYAEWDVKGLKDVINSSPNGAMRVYIHLFVTDPSFVEAQRDDNRRIVYNAATEDRISLPFVTQSTEYDLPTYRKNTWCEYGPVEVVYNYYTRRWEIVYTPTAASTVHPPSDYAARMYDVIFSNTMRIMSMEKECRMYILGDRQPLPDSSDEWYMLCRVKTMRPPDHVDPVWTDPSNDNIWLGFFMTVCGYAEVEIPVCLISDFAVWVLPHLMPSGSFSDRIDEVINKWAGTVVALHMTRDSLHCKLMCVGFSKVDCCDSVEYNQFLLHYNPNTAPVRPLEEVWPGEAHEEPLPIKKVNVDRHRRMVRSRVRDAHRRPMGTPPEAGWYTAPFQHFFIDSEI
jgi:hypothetical protein